MHVAIFFTSVTNMQLHDNSNLDSFISTVGINRDMNFEMLLSSANSRCAQLRDKCSKPAIAKAL